MKLKNQINSEKIDIGKTWITNSSSCTLTIPKEISKIYGLDKPSYIIIEKMNDGILIKKLQ